MTQIFKVKTGLPPELMNDIFEFIEQPYSRQTNSLLRPNDPKDKIWHKNKKYDIESLFKLI